jgi:predicted nucleic acid-binding protein
MTLVDTSSWIEALRRSGDPKVRDRVRRLLIDGDAAWCDMIRLELWNGASGEAEKKVLRMFEVDLPSLEIDAAVWDLAFDLARKARSAGVTIPSTDLLILACARRHGADLEHDDGHFDEAKKVLKP